MPLTENGERHAAKFREVLKNIKFTHVLTSPLQRARRTCELAGFGAVARVEPDLQEWDYGDYEGRTTGRYSRAATRLESVSRRLSAGRVGGANFPTRGPGAG